MGGSRRLHGWQRFFLAAGLLAGCHPSAQLAVFTGVGRIDAVDFGRVIVGETSTAKLKIENIQGGLFHLTAPPTIVGADASDFLLVQAPPLSVPQDGLATGQLSFSPLGAGQRSAQLTASTDNTSASVLSGALTGFGVAPGSVTLSVDPVELNFGQVEIQTSKMLLLKLTNTGADAAPLQPIRISASGQPTFTVAPEGETADAPDPLAAGASLTMGVTFSTPLELRISDRRASDSGLQAVRAAIGAAGGDRVHARPGLRPPDPDLQCHPGSGSDPARRAPEPGERDRHDHRHGVLGRRCGVVGRRRAFLGRSPAAASHASCHRAESLVQRHLWPTHPGRVSRPDGPGRASRADFGCKCGTDPGADHRDGHAGLRVDDPVLALLRVRGAAERQSDPDPDHREPGHRRVLGLPVGRGARQRSGVRVSAGPSSQSIRPRLRKRQPGDGLRPCRRERPLVTAGHAHHADQSIRPRDCQRRAFGVLPEHALRQPQSLAEILPRQRQQLPFRRRHQPDRPNAALAHADRKLRNVQPS